MNKFSIGDLVSKVDGNEALLVINTTVEHVLIDKLGWFPEIDFIPASKEQKIVYSVSNIRADIRKNKDGLYQTQYYGFDPVNNDRVQMHHDKHPTLEAACDHLKKSLMYTEEVAKLILNK